MPHKKPIEKRKRRKLMRQEDCLPRRCVIERGVSLKDLQGRIPFGADGGGCPSIPFPAAMVVGSAVQCLQAPRLEAWRSIRHCPQSVHGYITLCDVYQLGGDNGPRGSRRFDDASCAWSTNRQKAGTHRGGCGPVHDALGADLRSSQSLSSENRL